MRINLHVEPIQGIYTSSAGIHTCCSMHACLLASVTCNSYCFLHVCVCVCVCVCSLFCCGCVV